MILQGRPSFFTSSDSDPLCIFSRVPRDLQRCLPLLHKRFYQDGTSPRSSDIRSVAIMRLLKRCSALWTPCPHEGKLGSLAAPMSCCQARRRVYHSWSSCSCNRILLLVQDRRSIVCEWNPVGGEIKFKWFRFEVNIIFYIECSIKNI